MSDRNPLVVHPVNPVIPETVEAGDRLRIYYTGYTTTGVAQGPVDDAGWVEVKDEDNGAIYKALIETCEGLDELDPVRMAIVETIPQHKQFQGSLEEQLLILRATANRLGLYDADDYLRTDRYGS